MRDFLSRRLERFFAIQYYKLDPKDVNWTDGKPQKLPEFSEPETGNPFKQIIRVDSEAAQRQLDDADNTTKHKLSRQLYEYYNTHLNPEKKLTLEDADLDVILATCQSEEIFDISLEKSFKHPLDELASLNYPNIYNPNVKIQTKVQAKNALEHTAAVQYCINADPYSRDNFLPESFNGLGFQNLIYLVFKLMRFRDGWMRVNKAKLRDCSTEELVREPIWIGIGFLWTEKYVIVLKEGDDYE